VKLKNHNFRKKPAFFKNLAGHKANLKLSYVAALKVTIPYLIDINSQTSYIVSNLQDGKTHYMVATAYDREGNESPQGNVTVIYGGSKTFTIKPNANCKVDDVKGDVAERVINQSYAFLHGESRGLLRRRMKREKQ
jgi:hypothetical protein